MTTTNIILINDPAKGRALMLEYLLQGYETLIEYAVYNHKTNKCEYYEYLLKHPLTPSKRVVIKSQFKHRTN